MAKHRRSTLSLKPVSSLPALLELWRSVEDMQASSPAGAIIQLVRVTQALQEEPAKFGVAATAGGAPGPAQPLGCDLTVLVAMCGDRGGAKPPAGHHGGSLPPAPA